VCVILHRPPGVLPFTADPGLQNDNALVLFTDFYVENLMLKNPSHGIFQYASSLSFFITFTFYNHRPPGILPFTADPGLQNDNALVFIHRFYVENLMLKNPSRGIFQYASPLQSRTGKQ
jgi:hypothetical protein